VDAALSGHAYPIDEGCDSLARSGVLGSTFYPKGVPPK
jgi:hypothetical protein